MWRSRESTDCYEGYMINDIVIVIVTGSGGVSGIGSLPSDFFSITSEELKKDQQNKSEIVEREMMLRTKVDYLYRTFLK